jgi:hypothetical protein
MGSTVQVGTATDTVWLIPSFGGSMVLGEGWGACGCSVGSGDNSHLDRAEDEQNMWVSWLTLSLLHGTLDSKVQEGLSDQGV